MSIHVMNLVWSKAPCQGNTLLALLALADWSDDSGKSWPSVETLAKKSRQSERNCRTVIRVLESQKLISVQERDGHSSLFVINLELLGGQSLPPAKKSMRGGLRRKSLPNSAEIFAPYTSIYTPQDQKQPSGNPSLFEGIPSELKDPIRPTQKEKQAKEKFVLPDWIPLPEWNGWIEMRQKMRKPATELAQRYAVEDLQVLRINGENIKEIMRKAIVKNWLSFYAIGSNGTNHQAPPEDALARERRKEAERKQNGMAMRQVQR